MGITLRGLSGHSGCVSALQTSENHGLFSGGADGSIRCWQKLASALCFSCHHCCEGVLTDRIQHMVVLENTLIVAGGCSVALLDLGLGAGMKPRGDVVTCREVASLLADEVRLNVVAVHTDGTISVFSKSLELQGSSSCQDIVAP